MSTIPSDFGDGDNSPPSFEAIDSAENRVRLTRDAKRLYWTLDRPLSSAIKVMEPTYYDPGSPMEPYCLQTTPGEPLSWSPVTQSPLTEPKISSVIVHVDPSDDWENQWMEINGEHWDRTRNTT